MVYKRALRDSSPYRTYGISVTLCLRFSVYWKLASAEGAERIQMQEFMFTGCETNVN